MSELEKKNNELEKKNNALVDVSMFVGEETGFEGTDKDTFKTPFLKILQSLSPELKKSDPKYIEGAEPGMYCNSATRGLYKDLNVIVVKIEHSLVVWKPNRGGLVGSFNKHEEKEIVARKEGVYKWDKDGNEVIDTVELFCINADSPSDIFIFPVSGASLKHVKSFATRLRTLQSNGKNVNVTWAGIWNISTVEESNDKGSWFTIGNTPKFVRFITLEEKGSFVTPTQEMLKTAETDYSAIDSSEDSLNEEVEF